MKRLRKAAASRDRLFIFIDHTHLLPLILNHSPAVFPGLLKLDFDILRRLVSLFSRFIFVPNHTIETRLFERNMLSASLFVERILCDATHEPMVSFRSMRPSRRAFRLAPARTETYRRSVLPSLLRFHIGPNSVRNALQRNLLQN